MKDRRLRDIINLFDHKAEENYQKSAKVSNFQSNNFIEYKSKDDIHKTRSAEEYLNILTIFKRHHKYSQKILHVKNSINFISNVLLLQIALFLPQIMMKSV